MEHSTHKPKFAGSNPATAVTGSEKIAKKVKDLKSCCTVVEHSTHKPRFEGSNPVATNSGSDKTEKKWLT